jgi:predicted permease
MWVHYMNPSELTQDLAYGLRLIRKNPGFSTVAILTLAVAIGGNTAIFTAVNALVLKPPRVQDPERLARIYPGQSRMSWPNFVDLRDETTAVFSEMSAIRGATRTISVGGATFRAIGDAVSPAYFTMLGTSAARGRTLLPSDSRTDLVVLSDRTWRTRFSSDPAIVGRAIDLDGLSHEIIGVMPPLFSGLTPPGMMREFWTPLDAGPAGGLADRSMRSVEVIGRLRPGVAHAQAAAVLRTQALALRARHPQVDEAFTTIQARGVTGLDGFRGMAGALLPVFGFLGLMTIVAGFVLLIGCANIAALLLGRAAGRRRELAMRLALGAGRARLVRQLLTESLLLAFIGGAAGVVLAIWLAGTFNLIVAQLPFPLEFDLSLDHRVLVYALALTVVTVLLFGIVPARRASRVDLVPALRDDDGGTSRQRVRSVLIVGQVAICTILLVWGGLFVRSLANASDVDVGFDPSGVIVTDVNLGDVPQKAERMTALLYELQTRLEMARGIESVGMAWAVPLALMSREEFGGVFDAAAERSGPGGRVMANRLTPGWFETVRIPRLAGRDFRWTDDMSAPRVAVVNETLARQFWGGERQAIGRRLTWPVSETEWEAVEVIGVVGNSKYWTLGETIAPTIYLAARQQPGGGLNLHVRAADRADAVQAVRTELQRLAPGIAFDITSMSDAVDVALMPARVGASFTGGFGALAALLSMLGIYGVVSLSVVQRTREIGIRKAVGARTSQIVHMVVRSTAKLVCAGLAAGLAFGVLGARALSALMVDVRPADPLTTGGVIALVIVATLTASALPAMRAARIDPLIALKKE